VVEKFRTDGKVQEVCVKVICRTSDPTVVHDQFSSFATDASSHPNLIQVFRMSNPLQNPKAGLRPKAHLPAVNDTDEAMKAN
jgi:hypothetical protein